MEGLLLLIAAVTFGFALVSNRFEKSLITSPMIFSAIGVCVAVFNPEMLSEIDGRSVLEIVAELTLVVVLFTDASRIRLKLLFRQYRIPLRLLGVGLPLTVILGTLAAKIIVPEFSIWEAALLSAILAPTDAALGHAVVSSKRVPERIRQSLNVESGLNDGIVLPLVMLFAVLSSTGGDAEQNWLVYWILQVTLGPLVGIVVGFGGGYLLTLSRSAGWLNEHFRRLSGIALALLAWAGALHVGGNGFIAAFVAGMCISVFSDYIGEAMRDFGEAEGQLLSLATFLLFGAVLIVPTFEAFTIGCLVYAILSLTLIRMLPVLLALRGIGLQTPTYWFVGWFGPRGLASLLFALLVVSKFELPHSETILSFSVATVLLSMMAHGLSAIPGAELYARQLGSAGTPIESQPSESHREKFSAKDRGKNKS